MLESAPTQDPGKSPRDTVLILGAQGFIGRALRRRLAPTHRLLSVDLRPGESIEARVGEEVLQEKLFQCDLGARDQIDELFDAIAASDLRRLRGIVHLAAHYDFRNEPDPRYDRLHDAMPHLLEHIERRVCEGVPLVYASSMASLAPTRPGEPLTEYSPRLGAWMYPAYKIQAEDLLASADLARPVVQLVLAAVYSDMCELVPLYKQIELIRSRSPEKYFFPGPVNHGLTYVHVDEVARAFELAVDRFLGKRGLERFLIGQQRPVSYEEIHQRASCAFYDKELPLERIPSTLALVGAKILQAGARRLGKRRFLQPWMIEFAGEHFEFDLTHTKNRLGWHPQRTLHDDLDRILQLAAYHTDVWIEVNERRPW